MSDHLIIEFGALSRQIGTQLREQGINLSVEEEDRFEMIARAIVMLHLQDIIPDSVRDNARKKLMKKISNCVHSVKP
jgi:hypothetical protein